MSDEVTQPPIEQTEPANAESATDAKPETSQVLPVETLSVDVPVPAIETEASPVETPPISEPVSLPEPVIPPPPITTESIPSETISNPISIPKEEPVVVIPAQNPPVSKVPQSIQQIPQTPPIEPHPNPLLSNGEGEEEIQPPSPLVRGNDTPHPSLNTSTEVSGDPAKPDLASPLDAISLAFKVNMARARELLVKARMAIQIKKKKKLEKVMNLFLTKKKIKNSDVRDLLHITDETATVYLNILKKEGKIQPNGKGGWIYYTKI